MGQDWDGVVPREDQPRDEGTSVWRSTKFRIISALVILLLVAVLLTVVNNAIKTHQSTHLSFANVTKIDARVDAGSVTLFASSGNSVEIDRKIDYTLRGPSVSEKVEGDTLVIRQKCSGLHFGECATSYSLALPANVEADIRTQSGAVEADGIKGKLNVQTSGGKVDVSNTFGPLSFATDKGSFVGQSLQSLNLNGQSKSGKITIDFVVSPSAVDLKSVDGEILLQLPKTNTSYKVDAKSSNAKTTVDVKQDDNSPRTITAKSENGKVTVQHG